MKSKIIIPIFLISTILLVSGCIGQSSGNSSTTPEPVLEGTVKFMNNEKLGNILTDSSGRTLYTFDLDKPGDINCLKGACTVAWPPFIVKTQLKASPGFEGKIDVVERPDIGEKQVTYLGKPLYYYSKDLNIGDANGDGNQGTWHVVKQ